jgi:phage-related holin
MTPVLDVEAQGRPRRRFALNILQGAECPIGITSAVRCFVCPSRYGRECRNPDDCRYSVLRSRRETMSAVYGSSAWLVKWVAALLAAQWVAVPGPVHALLILQGLDLSAILLVGLLISRHIDGPGFWATVAKKGLTLIVIGAVHQCSEMLHFGFDLGSVGSLAFIVNETISILTHAALAGVPIPAQLLESLMRIQKLPKRKPRPDGGSVDCG